MFYYKGYLYCGLMDGLMCYGIIRVNVKNGKVKKLFLSVHQAVFAGAEF